MFDISKLKSPFLITRSGLLFNTGITGVCSYVSVVCNCDVTSTNEGRLHSSLEDSINSSLNTFW